MLLGVAIGDGLGNTTESQLPARRWAERGEIRDYLPNRYAGDQAVGVPSDDTQMAFWTVEHLLEHGRFVPELLSARFAKARIFGIGSSVRQFQANWSPERPWWTVGAPSAGNGALMRIAPMLLPHLAAPSSELWADAALSAAITHRDAAAISSAVAFTALDWDLLGRTAAPQPEWWLDRYVEVASEIEGSMPYVPRGGDWTDWQGPVWQFVDHEVRRALTRGGSTLATVNSWYSGAYLLETVPTALFILARHAADPEEAIIRAVNDTKDNDTIAAIVGAAVGALHGAAALPRRWLAGLTGRLEEADDGTVQALTERAILQYGTGS